MTTPQRKISSGFDARSTTKDVLRGIDLSKKLAIVTGGYSGLGLETTRALANAGAHVIVPARRPSTAKTALNGTNHTETDQLDLADLHSIHRFTQHFLATHRHIDILICNAGIMACPETRVGPGWEAQFATNHLGHYALVNQLWPAIAPNGARVITVSSGAHHISPIRWHDIHFTTGYDKWHAYGQAKTANILFAQHLDSLAQHTGVRAFSLHPGAILTPLQRHLPKTEMIANGWIDDNGALADPTFKTPQQGAATQVWAATSPQLAGKGGVYCEDCDIAEPPSIHPHATDPEQAARLWTLSAELTGIDTIRNTTEPAH